MTNEGSILSLLLSVGGLWVGHPAEGPVLIFLNFFLSPVGYCVSVVRVLVFIVGCICRWFSCVLLVVGCRLSSADFRLLGVADVGCCVGSWLSTVG